MPRPERNVLGWAARVASGVKQLANALLSSPGRVGSVRRRSASRRHAPQPTPAALGQLAPLAIFPKDVTEVIFQQADLHVRQVCHALRALHPPILSLAPYGCPTVASLQASLAALPPTLTYLDLRATPSRLPRSRTIRIGTELINPTTLATIAATLPNLQSLTLPPFLPTSLTAALLTTLRALPTLHTLHAALLPSADADPADWRPLFAPPIATRIRSLSLPVTAFDLTPAAPAGCLPQLTALDLTHAGVPLEAGVLSALAKAAPGLRCLSMNIMRFTGRQLELAGCLPGFTALNELTFISQAPEPDQPTAEVLPHIASLTTLHTLSLLLHYAHWAGPTAGWLDPLTALTCLELALKLDSPSLQDWADDDTDELGQDTPGAEGRRLVSGLAASIVQLPLLQVLSISLSSYNTPRLAAGEPGSFFQHLAAATQLRSLRLARAPLRPAEVGLLTSLTGLTALTLLRCGGTSPVVTAPDGPDPPTLQWVATLPQLQRLHWVSQGASKRCVPEWQALAGLTRLHTLSVQLHRGWPLSPPLLELLVAMRGHLTRLQLGGGPGWYHDEPDAEEGEPAGGPAVRWDALRVFGEMEGLRVLDLHDMWCGGDVAGVVEHLQLPRSLRQCHVPEELEGHDLLRRLREAYPLVGFRESV